MSASPEGNNSTHDETYPLLATYEERQRQRDENSEGSSQITFLQWTTFDEMKRCTCAVLSFMLMAALVGSALVLFWFLWAWLVLYLNLPGILTPIVWLAGFLMPLCIFKFAQLCPRCLRILCAKPLTPPDINAWKTHHLWNIRRKFVNNIMQATPFPLTLAEMISDFCFHSDILVTTNKNKLVGIYPDTARLHTVAEFSKNITDLAVSKGNIHSVYVLISRESEKVIYNCRERLCCSGDGEEGNAPTTDTQVHTANRTLLTNVPSWLWDDFEQMDLMICEYDIAKGLLNKTSQMFQFTQISNTTLQQLRGIYYEPNYRLLIDPVRNILVVSRDGDFVVFDNKLQVLQRRELIAHPENRDDREQFLHLREYRFNAARIIPYSVVLNILKIVDSVEDTNSENLINNNDTYVIIPFGHHALFVGNIMTGWLRYLDFSHVEPISETEIHYCEFSVDDQCMYLCLTQSLSVMSTVNFQPILTVPFTNLEYTMPCGLIRTPATEDQVLLMMSRHRQRLLTSLKKKNMHEEDEKHFALDLDVNKNSFECVLHNNMPANVEEFLVENEKLNRYKQRLANELESIAVIFASTRIFMDPRIFLYRFPDSQCRVVSHGNGSRRSIYSGGSFLVDRVNNDGTGKSSDSGGQWHYISLKHRPWKEYHMPRKLLMGGDENGGVCGLGNVVVPMIGH